MWRISDMWLILDFSLYRNLNDYADEVCKILSFIACQSEDESKLYSYLSCQ